MAKMTEKAQHILDAIKRQRRNRILNDFNQSTLDDVGPVGGKDQGMKVLEEMNELQDFENENWSKGSV